MDDARAIMSFGSIFVVAHASAHIGSPKLGAAVVVAWLAIAWTQYCAMYEPGADVRALTCDMFMYFVYLMVASTGVESACRAYHDVYEQHMKYDEEHK